MNLKTKDNGHPRLIRALVAALNEHFDQQPAEAVLRWGLETFAPRVALGTGFGPSGVVLCHMVSQIQPNATIFYLDTELLFPETYSLRDRLEAELGICFTRVHCGLSLEEQERQWGRALWQQCPDDCCRLRKVEPLRRFLADKDIWITGVRRDQSPTRSGVQMLEWSVANDVVKLNPLANWTATEVWAYIERHRLPFNPLHRRGYPSIGCWPCTRPVAPGEDPRAGRWAGSAKLECGIHLDRNGGCRLPSRSGGGQGRR